MKQDNNNLFLAIGLSLLIVFAWQYFYAAPQMERARQSRELAQKQQLTEPAAAPVIPAADAPGARSRAQALADGRRIQIDTPKLSGSIALTGARIDDVSLRAYHETIDPSSPTIELFSPAGAPNAFFADIGYVPLPGADNPPPGPDAVWSADADRLTPEKPVTLTYDNGKGLVFSRRIAVDDQYMFTIADQVTNSSAQPVGLFAHAGFTRQGHPPLSGYSVLHEGLVGVIGENREQEITYDEIVKEPGQTRALKGTGGWLGITDKYWAGAIIPDQNQPFNALFSASGGLMKTYKSETLGEVTQIAPGATASFQTRLFAGAKETALLERYQKEQGVKNFDLLISWGWFYFLTKPMFWALDYLYKITGNFGFAILLLTLIVKGLFFPLANRSYMSMAKMKNLQPKLAEIKERFPDDKQKQQQETMELYKKEKINPVAGCLPMLIQIPVFFSLYKVLFITIEMRHAPFIGWIHDLSAPDPTNIFTLFGLVPGDPTALPVFGSFLHLGVWPVLMGISMFIQMKMNPEPADPVQKQMFTYMPLIFTFTLGSFSSGLVIYWTWNNLLSVIQQGVIMKKAGAKIELWDNLAGLFGRKKPA